MRRKTKRRAPRNIARVDYPRKRMHGYLLRVRFDGQFYSEWFSDSHWGGRVDALHAALDKRAEVWRALGRPYTERVVNARTMQPATGVHLRTKQGCLVYEATWPAHPNRVARTSFSVQKHGRKKAERLARQARAAGLRRVLLGLADGRG